MPDKNKFAKLREVGFRFPTTCSLCKYSDFSWGNLWGVCSRFSYKHLKHTGDERPLGIHALGGCEEHFVLDEENAVPRLESYAEFLPGRKT